MSTSATCSSSTTIPIPAGPLEDPRRRRCACARRPGETALVAMRQVMPDVVVLDLMMPVLAGFGMLATMRAHPLLCQVPVVVLTAKSLTEAERQFLARTSAET